METLPTSSLERILLLDSSFDSAFASHERIVLSRARDVHSFESNREIVVKDTELTEEKRHLYLYPVDVLSALIKDKRTIPHLYSTQQTKNDSWSIAGEDFINHIKRHRHLIETTDDASIAARACVSTFFPMEVRANMTMDSIFSASPLILEVLLDAAMAPLRQHFSAFSSTLPIPAFEKPTKDMRWNFFRKIMGGNRLTYLGETSRSNLSEILLPFANLDDEWDFHPTTTSRDATLNPSAYAGRIRDGRLSMMSEMMWALRNREYALFDSALTVLYGMGDEWDWIPYGASPEDYEEMFSYAYQAEEYPIEFVRENIRRVILNAKKKREKRMMS